MFDKASATETVSMAGWGLGGDQGCLTTNGGPSPFQPCKVKINRYSDVDEACLF